MDEKDIFDPIAPSEITAPLQPEDFSGYGYDSTTAQADRGNQAEDYAAFASGDVPPTASVSQIPVQQQPVYQMYQQPYQQQWDAPQPPAPKQPKRKNTGKILFAIFAVLAVMVGVVVGIAAYRGLYAPNSSLGTRGSDNTQLSGVPNDNSRMELAVTPEGDKSVAEKAGGLTPVQIHEKLRNANVAVQLYNGRSSTAVGEGSGILIHEDSKKQYTYVVTCAHVISGGNQRISIELEDGTSYDAEIVGLDNRTDVGLLRIKKTGLQGATFGDSDQLKVGEPIYAIGNPGGIDFKGSFTSGIVSAIDRAITSKYKMKTIQHTAAINPGNSGGALVNALGQVIGINSQKIVDTEYEGMGFAVPSKEVQKIVNDLIANGYVPNRPKLGIQYVAASQTQAGYWVVRSNNLPSGSLIIAKIDEESNLSGTDVQPNDIITHVNGKALNKADILLQAVENGKVGDVLKLTIARVNPGDYSVDSFEVSAKLVEDKGGSSSYEEETQPWYYDQFGGEFGW